MTNPQVDAIVSMVEDALPASKGLEAALDAVKRRNEALMPGVLSPEIYDHAHKILTKRLENIEVIKVNSVIRKRDPWYYGSKPSDLHWPALKKYLINAKNWHPDDVESIDATSTEVVSLLNNPKEEKFTCKGLVVGHVQSGKTANMTAVMAKAIDAGYNTIIVLAGLTNKLRQQTQLRIMSDLVDRRREYWHVRTAVDEDGDFQKPPSGGLLSQSDGVQLAVVKKNVSPLGKLFLAIQETPPLALKRLKVLIIDDECDQASVNSASGETDMTAINERIRELLKLFPSVTYVGYTATPFANVFINPYKPDGVTLDDLYPSEFITSLPTPERYFGASKLFGQPPVESDRDDDGDDGLDMIRHIDDDEIHLLQPAKAKERDEFQPAMAPSLEQAILYFLGCCAARRVRGDFDKHMSMLVHTSAFVTMHEKLASLIQGWLKVKDSELRVSDSPLSQRLREIWELETGRLGADICVEPPVHFSDLIKEIPAVLDLIEVPVENGASDDRIDYEGEPKTYIVVGGSVLARGLTIEGLMVSYFLRSASQYDTLLQMGRWFGYRPRYEDLPRIWTTEDLALRFRSLAGIEAEIREEIEEYKVREITPMDMAVRVRAIPGMAITTASKMKAANRCAISYWGTHRQTFRFNHHDHAMLAKNWQVAADLVSQAENLGLRDATGDKMLWVDVPRTTVNRFFSSYLPHSDHKDLSAKALSEFVEGAGKALDKWNVAIIGSSRGKLSGEALGVIGKVPTVNRAKLKSASGTHTADIKALMSRSDLVVDSGLKFEKSMKWAELKIEREKQVGSKPLLLLYVIDKDSKPQSDGSKTRSNLEAVSDILGYGVVFPGSKDASGNYFSVELDYVSGDEIEQIDEEERAQAEAADV
ncbi:Z1 domain-containing protein [Marinobacter nauticus]|uniref:Z1 domain-containing protein n=1 Tax=Marinobacter nauticus TaxID=2743 RepID=UPI001C582823|nr:Z1 domain-containing protein [Marinobacter nauticus]MBW3196769.1 Z1 domain-containing protein [Marinobacter nauticus]MBY6182179.1 Z1 domain-containing protein [Marinobacter nauticus]